MKKYILIIILIYFSVIASAAETSWGFLKITGQAWYQIEEDSVNTFKIKRLRVKTGGDLADGLVSLSTQVEMNTDEYNILDLKLTLNGSVIDITAGRFLVPLDIYTPSSLWKIATIEYPLIDEFSPWRQEGVMIKAKLPMSRLYLAAVNGGGSNSYTDSDSEKAYMLRLDFAPWDGIYLGGSFWNDHSNDGTRWNIERVGSAFVHIREKNFLFSGQFSYSEEEDDDDVNIYSYGYFVNLSFYLSSMEFVTRYEFLDTGMNTLGDIRTRLTVGFNYDGLGKGIRFSANYQINGESQDLLNNRFIFQIMGEL